LLLIFWGIQNQPQSRYQLEQNQPVNKITNQINSNQNDLKNDVAIDTFKKQPPKSSANFQNTTNNLSSPPSNFQNLSTNPQPPTINLPAPPTPQIHAMVEISNLGSFWVDLEGGDTAFSILLKAGDENNFSIKY